jgi:hypothetical protein
MGERIRRIGQMETDFFVIPQETPDSCGMTNAMARKNPFPSAQSA